MKRGPNSKGASQTGGLVLLKQLLQSFAILAVEVVDLPET